MKKLQLLFPFLVAISLGCTNCSYDKNKNITLLYYKYINPDSLKYEAACFLFNNINYHYPDTWMQSDNNFEEFVQEMNNIYSKMDNTPSIIYPLEDTIPIPIKEHDTKKINWKFLIDHIDNAFTVWRKSPFAKNLSFDEFKEYILPYTSIDNLGVNVSGKCLNQAFQNILMKDSSYSRTVQNYNNFISYAKKIRKNTSEYPYGNIYDLFCENGTDCVGSAGYACNILRSIGLPLVVEYNIAYSCWSGRHFHCNFYNDSTNCWQTFSPEVSIPGELDLSKALTLNIYRLLFKAQPETPYFLKQKDEYVPEELSHPCIKDVSRNYKETVSIKLPFNFTKTHNNLAYLAVFTNDEDGIIPVTWGRINNLKDSIIFDNVVLDNVYFPIYYPTERYEAFANPFYITKNSCGQILIHYIKPNKNEKPIHNVIINRKFPVKKNILETDSNIVGGYFWAANQEDFKDSVTLYSITNTPDYWFKEYMLNNNQAYKFYGFTASTPYSLLLSKLEWITQSSFNYPNPIPPSPLHCLVPNDTVLLKKDVKLVQLIDSLYEEDDEAYVYDNNMQTCPNRLSNIILALDSPRIITQVRFSLWNAENGIKPGNTYDLYMWDKKWKYIETQTAQYEYLSFKTLYHNRLYWLHNRTEGKEEMPFLIIKGKQRFIYWNNLFDLTKS